jgi:hypothetical protein
MLANKGLNLDWQLPERLVISSVVHALNRGICLS